MRILWVLSLSCLLGVVAPLEAASDKPKRGGTLTMAMVKDIEVMHPLVSTSSNEQRVRDLMFESLLGVDSNGKIQPNLAQSWEISGNGKLYTFHLRKGVKFHDGREMTPEDIKYAVEYSKDPKNAAYGLNILAAVDRVEVEGKYTVKFLLKKPSVPFLASLTDIQGFSVVPKGSLPEGVTKLSRFPPGTGPFKFIEWQQGQRIVFERYEGYWGQKAFVDRLILRPFSDNAIRFIALQAGDVDMVEQAPLEWASQISEGKIKGIYAVKVPYGAFFHLVFNVTAPPFNNKKLRQAVAHAIDKQELINAGFFGLGEPADQGYPAGHFWHIEGVARRTRDLAKASALLKEAGYQGETIVIHITPGYREPMTISLQQQLKKVGMNIKIEMMDSVAQRSRTQSGDFTMSFSGGRTQTDPYVTYAQGTRCEPNLNKRRSNYSGYCDKELERLLDQAETELDPSKRRAIFRQILSKHFEDVPGIPVGYGPKFFSMRDYVRGFNDTGGDNYRWWDGGLNYTWLDK